MIVWERRLAEFKPTLMLYALLHELIHQEIEGDELYTMYTKVDKNVPPSEAEGGIPLICYYFPLFSINSSLSYG